MHERLVSQRRRIFGYMTDPKLVEFWPPNQVKRSSHDTPAKCHQHVLIPDPSSQHLSAAILRTVVLGTQPDSSQLNLNWADLSKGLAEYRLTSCDWILDNIRLWRGHEVIMRLHPPQIPA